MSDARERYRFAVEIDGSTWLEPAGPMIAAADYKIERLEAPDDGGASFFAALMEQSKLLHMVEVWDARCWGDWLSNEAHESGEGGF